MGKVVDKSLYLSYLAEDGSTHPPFAPSNNTEIHPALTQAYKRSTPVPNSILDRADCSAHPTSALQAAERQCVELQAMGVLLRSSYSASETSRQNEGGSDKFELLRGYTPPAPEA